MFTLVEVPYHMGMEEVAVGKGPRRLLAAGADRALAVRGVPAEVAHLEKFAGARTELDAVVDVNRRVRAAVRDTLARGRRPVVLAGNCNSCLGTLAGMEPGRTGVVWFDRHGDANTPATSPSGMLEGMALAIAMGHCHEDLRERIGMAQTVEEENVLLAGAWDLDPGEGARLAASRVAVLAVEDVPTNAELLARRVEQVYVHVDVDVLDRTPPGTLVAVFGRLLASAPVEAVAIANYNPERDPGGRVERAVLDLLCALAATPGTGE